MERYDVVIVGAGIAGAGLAAALTGRRVLLLEAEAQPGYHTTGRSAALYAAIYGNRDIRILTLASRPALESPPTGFADAPLLAPRGMVYVAPTGRVDALQALQDELGASNPLLDRVDAARLAELCPVLRPEAAAAGLLDRDAMDIDVDRLHRGYLRAARAAGVELVCAARVVAVEHDAGRWILRTGAGAVAADCVVNAAGAWADEFARMAGVAPVGLRPCRRTAFTFDAPDGVSVRDWPAVIDVDEQWYLKPDAGRLLGSPADETETMPCDAQPEELDVAIGVDRIERATTLSVRRLVSRWAGLRSFVSDRSPVVGFDAAAEGFFWLAAQGGYGIQTAPALSAAAAGLLLRGRLPAELSDRGLDPQSLSASRLR